MMVNSLLVCFLFSFLNYSQPWQIHNQSLQSIMKPEDLFVTQLKAQAKESHSQLFKVFCWWPKSKKKTTSTPTSIVYTASDFPMGMENFMPKREANYKFSENSVDSSYAAVSKVPRVFPSMVTPMSVVSSTLDLRPKLSSNGIYGDFQPALPPEFNNFTMQKRNSLISRKLWVYRPKTLTVKPSEIHAYTNEALDLEEHNFEPRTIIPCESDTPSKLLKIGQIEEVRTAF